MRIERSYRCWNSLAFIFFMLLIAWFINGLAPAKASNYDLFAELEIPTAHINVGVTSISLEGRALHTPDDVAGAFYGARNKVLLIGHRGTVFYNLDKASPGDMARFDGKNYVILDSVTLAKSDVNMNDILSAADAETIVIMTCSGEDLGGGDATHRLILIAERTDV